MAVSVLATPIAVDFGAVRAGFLRKAKDHGLWIECDLGTAAASRVIEEQAVATDRACEKLHGDSLSELKLSLSNGLSLRRGQVALANAKCAALAVQPIWRSVAIAATP